MRRPLLLPFLLLAAACATVGIGVDVQGGFEQGLAALSRQDYPAAAERFDWVVNTSGPSDGLAQHAMLVRTTVAMDSRNPGRDLTRAAELAAQLRDAGNAWTPAVGESLRLLATELETANKRLAHLEAARHVAASVSGMVQRGLALRLDSVTIERDTLRRKVTTLEQQLDERDKQLKEKEQELERIRKIIRN
ncbi:MAG: hypothetical protein ACREL7_07875 [Longimicrobiales bacterium]